MNTETGQIVSYVLVGLAAFVVLAQQVVLFVRKQGIWQDKLPEEVWKTIESVLDALRNVVGVTKPIIEQALGALYDSVAAEWPPLLKLVSREKFVAFFLARMKMEARGLRDVHRVVIRSTPRAMDHDAEIEWPRYPNL